MKRNKNVSIITLSKISQVFYTIPYTSYLISGLKLSIKFFVRFCLFNLVSVYDRGL